MPEPAADIANLSFEQAMKELEQIVRRLESGQGELEKAIEDYARGTALKAHCEKRLADARMKVEKIVQTPDGRMTAEKLDAD
ncbi:MAG: exodeoxyribonuclease VII small subunit [Alphaproteobacteria bacterium]|nr:exodeoxyribonuclease VII small subunit [Alphaproteobacteria bacterium]